jgi:hypothetical protein
MASIISARAALARDMARDKAFAALALDMVWVWGILKTNTILLKSSIHDIFIVNLLH